MNIRIVNLKSYTPRKDEVLIKVDRSTVVGNPFPMRSEAQRDEVCRKYNEYFGNIVKNPDSNKEFMDYLRYIYKVSRLHNIALGCWCAPKRCHAETIKAFIEKYTKL